jgi:glycogen debranching enzyme
MTAPIRFGPHTCALDDGAWREWLVADGLGGYACGTVGGLRTRDRHGLLAVADPATGRARLALAALDLTVTLPSGAKVALFTHQWASGAVDPAGHTYLETFSLVDGVPRWRWRIGDVVIERELALWHGRPSLAVVHRVVAAPGPVGVAVAAMCAPGPGAAPPRVDPVADGVVVAGAYRIAGPGWQPGGDWHYGAATRADAAVADLWWAGTSFARVGPGATCEISAWAGTLHERPPAATAVLAATRERACALVSAAKAEGSGGPLVLAADAFVVRGADGPDVVAGYPEPAGHPGDTTAAYEGLFLATGRLEEGRELLRVRTRAAVRAARTPGPRDPVDAPLWLVHAVERHVTRTGDGDLAAELVGPLARLLRAHLAGAGPLRLDPADELLRLDAPASTDDGPARVGKPVDLNALWVNALGALCELLAETGRDSGPARARHARARASFAARYRAPEGWLYDLVEGPAGAYPLGAGAFHDDPSLRPGQLLAWSLPHAPLAGSGDPAADRRAVRAVGAALLTPLGLRTLAPAEYGYAGAADRDATGHQGTVWPWLIGAYADACAATGLPTDGLLTGLEAHVHEWGVGSISEAADGDPPHRAAGNPFCARGVAEVLRVRGFAS